MLISGKVKSITEYKCKASDKFGKIIKGDLIEVMVLKYDDKGNQVEDREYKSNGDLKQKYMAV